MFNRLTCIALRVDIDVASRVYDRTLVNVHVQALHLQMRMRTHARTYIYTYTHTRTSHTQQA